MSHTSRRNFLKASSAVAGTILSSNLLAKEKKVVESPASLDLVSESGLITGQKKALNYHSIPGFLSEEQIKIHFEGHYGGALKGLSHCRSYVTIKHR